VRLLDRHGEEIPRGGGNLIVLDRFDDSGLISGAEAATFTILCDVQNPLLGAKGAAMTFAPQKGAGHIETMLLERCLATFGEKCEAWSGKKLVGMRGGGAAGGVAVGLNTFFNTKIISGVSFILDLLEAEKQINWADLVITAEGALDSQTFGGKAPSVLARKVKKAGKKMICIAGKVPHRADHPDSLFDAVFAMQNQPMTLEESIASTTENIMNTAYEIGRLIGE
jgi:glycerate kinase